MKLTSKKLSPEINAELHEVHQSLVAVADALNFPLNNLVNEEIRKAEPFVRAGVVLATACDNEDQDSLRTQRINLAAALEMLHIALNIHKLLLSPTTQNRSINGESESESDFNAIKESASVDESASVEQSTVTDESTVEKSDKIVMGSTILAGDYCFSRSAALATKTGSPEVVNIFSEALKTVSEEHLRSIFNNDSLFGQEDETLVLAGIQASIVLINSTAETEIALKNVSKQLIERLHLSEAPSDSVLNELASHDKILSDAQRTRWREILLWLIS